MAVEAKKSTLLNSQFNLLINLKELAFNKHDQNKLKSENKDARKYILQ
jgi:hypothetical protein